MEHSESEDISERSGKLGVVPDAYPPKHAKYLLERNGVTFTAMACTNRGG